MKLEITHILKMSWNNLLANGTSSSTHTTMDFSVGLCLWAHIVIKFYEVQLFLNLGIIVKSSVEQWGSRSIRGGLC
jgi:hypothetical protein